MLIQVLQNGKWIRANLVNIYDNGIVASFNSGEFGRGIKFFPEGEYALLW